MTESEIRAIKTRQMDKLAEWREHLYREPELRELFILCAAEKLPEKADGTLTVLFALVLNGRE